MDLEDVVLVGSVREKVRTHATTVNPAGIMDRIKAWEVESHERPAEVPAPFSPMPPPVFPETPPATEGDEWAEDEWADYATPPRSTSSGRFFGM